MSSDLSDAGDSSRAGKRSLVKPPSKADVSPCNIEGVDLSMIDEEDLEPPFKIREGSESRRRELFMGPSSEKSSLHFSSDLKEVKLPEAEDKVDLPMIEDYYTDPDDYSDPEEYSSIETIFFSGPIIGLYWNLEHYPIPDGANLDSIYTNIKFALHKLSFHGCLEINAYGDEPIHAKDAHYSHVMRFTPPEGGGKSTAGQMSRDILDFLYTQLIDVKPPIVVLSEEYPELRRVLYSLRSRNHHVLEIVPTPQQGGLFDSVASILGCTQFLGGGTTRTKRRLQRCSLLPPIKEPKAAVFWDQLDYPFPSLPWDEIPKKIQSALRYRGVVGLISTSVYVGEKHLGMDRHASYRNDRLVFEIDYHKGADNKTARLERMLNDIYLWLIDNREDRPTKLFVVADGVRDDMEFFDFLELLTKTGYHVYLVNLPKGTKPEISDWPGLLFDTVVTTFT